MDPRYPPGSIFLPVYSPEVGGWLRPPALEPSPVLQRCLDGVRWSKERDAVIEGMRRVAIQNRVLPTFALQVDTLLTQMEREVEELKRIMRGFDLEVRQMYPGAEGFTDAQYMEWSRQVEVKNENVKSENEGESSGIFEDPLNDGNRF